MAPLWSDPDMPAAEVRCGLAEIVKHGAIADDRLFGFLARNSGRLLKLDPTTVERTVSDSVRIRAGIVEGDEREAGERRKLNFGHTFGHAIEKVSGAPHGMAVSAGMVLAAAR
jgi:3-dehydroquinate synthase